MLLTKALCIDIMVDALRAPVRLECSPGAGRVRQCFYRARRRRQKEGDHRFDGLTFRVDGSTLVIKKRPITAAHRLRAKLKTIRALRALINCH